MCYSLLLRFLLPKFNIFSVNMLFFSVGNYGLARIAPTSARQLHQSPGCSPLSSIPINFVVHFAYLSKNFRALIYITIGADTTRSVKLVLTGVLSVNLYISVLCCCQYSPSFSLKRGGCQYHYPHSLLRAAGLVTAQSKRYFQIQGPSIVCQRF